MTLSRSGLVLLASILLGAVGCTTRELAPLNPCTQSVVSIKVHVETAENVDLLFMIDNSNSMAEEQRALQAQFPRMVQSILGGDPDFDPTNPAYVDPNPANNSAPAKSLRIGVVSSDMGVQGMGENQGEPTIGTCSAAGRPAKARYGDDGILVTVARANTGPDGLPGTVDDNACTAEAGQTLGTIPAFLTYPNAADPTLAIDPFAQRVSCFAVLGTTGCGFEQPLESVLKAVTPASSPIRFYADPTEPNEAYGQSGTGGNGSWFRTNSVLAIVMLGDEDDCSAADRRIYDYTDCTFPDPANQRCTNPSAPAYTGWQSDTRCERLPNLLQPVSRYVDGIVALRPDEPRSIVFAAITGVPPALVDGVDASSNPAPGEGTTNFDAILADPAMAATLQGNNTTVMPACGRCPDYNGDGLCNPIELQNAAPGRRVVEVAKGLAEKNVSVVVQSICQDSFDGTAHAILEKIAEAIRSACLPRDLHRDATNRVACDVLETLSSTNAHCADAASVAAGRDPAPVRTENGREVCRVRQLSVDPATRVSGSAPAGTGWYYDDYTGAIATSCGAGSQRIAFTGDATPMEGSVLRLECLELIEGSGLALDVNSPCGASTTYPTCQLSRADYATFALRYNLWQDYDASYPLFCEYDSNTCQIACSTDADCPGGFDCYDDPLDDDARQGGHSKFCVNPTCNAATH